MHLLAKTPADRPASARAVVEAIGSIEREVQAERQRAELSPASPIPVAADAARRTPDGVAGGQGAPGAGTLARRVRRTLAIIAAAALLGIAASWVMIDLRPRSAGAIVPDHIRMPIVAAPVPSRSGSAARLRLRARRLRSRPTRPRRAAGRGPSRARVEGPRAPTPDLDPPRLEGPFEARDERGGEANRGALGSGPDRRSRWRLPADPPGQCERSSLDPRTRRRPPLERRDRPDERAVHPAGGYGRFRGPREGQGDRQPRQPGVNDPVRPLPWRRNPPLERPGKLRPPGDRGGSPQERDLSVRQLRAPSGRPPGLLLGPQDRGRLELPPAPTSGRRGPRGLQPRRLPLDIVRPPERASPRSRGDRGRGSQLGHEAAGSPFRRVPAHHQPRGRIRSRHRPDPVEGTGAARGDGPDSRGEAESSRSSRRPDPTRDPRPAISTVVRTGAIAPADLTRPPGRIACAARCGACRRACRSGSGGASR